MKSQSDSPGSQSDTREDVQVHLISLGCPKNLVDSEMILGGLGSHGLVVTPDADSADVIVVNTCGFIDSAKEESIDTILEACDLKHSSERPKKVVVTGCLGQRYGAELEKEIPELDAIVGLGEYGDLGDTLLKLVDRDQDALHLQVTDPTKACFAEVGRFRLTPQHFAYLRISEGCDNPCTFCAIPSFRGRFRSKTIPMILQEARELASTGVKELVLISQDTTSYGVDLDGTFQLDRLLEELGQVDGIEWIRLLYAYPAYTSDAMIDAIARVPKVLNYVDIPIQHIANPMLKRMGRRMNEDDTRALLERMRDRIPNLVLRTTFIVGFPGETEQDFETLRSFVDEFRFERLGVFPFSPEDGTPSANFDGQLSDEIKQARHDAIMITQQPHAFEQNRARIGTEETVIVDRIEENDDGELVAIARSYGEAPEIDPVIHIISTPKTEAEKAAADFVARDAFREISMSAGSGVSSEAPNSTHSATQIENLSEGDFVRVTIRASKDYDLLATIAAP